MKELEWLVPSAILTGAFGAIGLFFMPDYSAALGALSLLPLWMMAAVVLASFLGLGMMIKARVQRPLSHIANSVASRPDFLLLMLVGTLLAGLNMITFMWAKPLLNILTPFWADPLLADADYILFLGNDPWKFLSWLNAMPTAIFYHRGWFALMIVTILLVLSRPASSEKSAIMLSYFLLWSAAGPLVHMLLPAGGPVFFDQLGYGDRFVAIPLPKEMVLMSNYLWISYSTGQFAPGSGISAMPSLHIATTAWMIIAVYVFARHWVWVMAGLGLLIFLLSISLGWHYAVDGIVGAAAAVGCYWLCKRWMDRGIFRWRQRRAVLATS